MLSPGYLLRVSRPRFWIYIFGPFIVGLVAGAESIDRLYTWASAIFGLYFLFPANLLIYGVNDIFDYETDRLNSKKEDYEQLVEPVSHKQLLAVIVLTNLPFAIAAIYFTPGAAIPLLCFYFFSIFYSAPPIRAKAVPFLDSAFNILYLFPGVFAYKMISGEFPPAALFAAGAAWTAAMHAYSAIPDIESDRAASLRTIATVLGRRGTHIFCLAMYLIAAALSYPHLGWLSLAVGIVYSAMVLLSLRTAGDKTFGIYKLFPLINSLCGFALFWYIALPKIF